jgi:hypothetical protein
MIREGKLAAKVLHASSIQEVSAEFVSLHEYFPVKTHKFSSDRNGGHKLFKTSCSIRVFTTKKWDEMRSNTNIVGGYEN